MSIRAQEIEALEEEMIRMVILLMEQTPDGIERVYRAVIEGTRAFTAQPQAQRP